MRAIDVFLVLRMCQGFRKNIRLGVICHDWKCFQDERHFGKYKEWVF